MTRSSQARVCFLYIAQAHQVLHSIGAAYELAQRAPDIAVDILATDPSVLAYAERMLERLGGGGGIGLDLLGPEWLRQAHGAGRHPPKVPLLVANAARLAQYDAVVTPERTSACLRKLGLRRTKLVYTQHGAGDRAGPFEPRLRLFDLVFAAGEKQRERMRREGLVSDETCAVVGYPKFDVVERLSPRLPRLFATDRPTVLYNPHFDLRLSSWAASGTAVLEAFARQSEYNLIFAPHMRLFGGEAPERIAALRPFVGAPHIHIDTGASERATDMTYTRSADIYLGDVSSQIYEFIHRPRPALFINAHDAQWRSDESYGHWRFGEVIEPAADVLGAVRRSHAAHLVYRAEQIVGRQNTFDLTDEPSSIRAAAAIASVIGRRLWREQPANTGTTAIPARARRAGARAEPAPVG